MTMVTVVATMMLVHLPQLTNLPQAMLLESEGKVIRAGTDDGDNNDGGDDDDDTFSLSPTYTTAPGSG